jgi:hypothetical protein
MSGYLEQPSYREPLMFDGGDVEVRKAGCEPWDKCCFCIPVETGMKLVAILAWLDAVGMVIIALTMGVAGAVATGATDITSDLTKGMTAEQKKTFEAASKHAKSASSGISDGDIQFFMILCFVAAFLSLTAAILMSYWMCCSKGSAGGYKMLFWGTIAQALSYAIFTVGFFIGATVSGGISACVTLLWYVYIVTVAKRLHDDKNGSGEIEAVAADNTVQA